MQEKRIGTVKNLDALREQLGVTNRPLYAEVPAYHPGHRAWLRLCQLRQPNHDDELERKGYASYPIWLYRLALVEYPNEYIRGYWEDDMDVTSSEATEFVEVKLASEDSLEWMLSKWLEDASTFVDQRTSRCPD